jgi:hypothetical protein
VLAAAVVVCAPGPRVAMLGFAGGGMMAPLRKMGGEHAVSAVDLDDAGHRLYSGIVGDWGGELEFTRGDAVKWLRGQRRKVKARGADGDEPPPDAWSDVGRDDERVPAR